jgi:pSer/pThr/pTyr-binding forkhead associated (FHA) protein
VPKLLLQFDGRVLKEVPLGRQVMIGRVPDNQIVIDNPAVSSRHARVYADNSGFTVEDLQSVNGTFVNDKRVTRSTLQDGDQIQIGKHRLTFVWAPGEAPMEEQTAVAPLMADLGGTMVLDTRDHRELVAKSEDAPAPAGPSGGSSKSRTALAVAAAARVGSLTVLSGKSDLSEYALSAATSLIGRSDTALVRLKGWFKPDVAAAIARKGELYTLTALKGRVSVNGQMVNGRQNLADGDVLEVSGVTMEFTLG